MSVSDWSAAAATAAAATLHAAATAATTSAAAGCGVGGDQEGCEEAIRGLQRQLCRRCGHDAEEQGLERRGNKQ